MTYPNPEQVQRFKMLHNITLEEVQASRYDPDNGFYQVQIRDGGWLRGKITHTCGHYHRDSYSARECVDLCTDGGWMNAFVHPIAEPWTGIRWWYTKRLEDPALMVPWEPLLEREQTERGTE